MALTHCCADSLTLVPYRVFSTSGCSKLGVLPLWTSLLTLFSFLFQLKTTHCQLPPSREACVCSLLTAQPLTISCCYSFSFLSAMWLFGSLRYIMTLKCRFWNPLLTSNIRISGNGARESEFFFWYVIWFLSTNSSRSATLWHGKAGDCFSYEIFSDACRHRFIFAP